MREFELLQHVFGRNADLPESVSIPPGDDMGAITLGGQTVLMTVDQVIDGIHVNTGSSPLDLIARKSIVRNLSDVAAMAALPVAAVVAACLPRDFGEDRTRQLFDALAETAERYRCPLVGGDISIADRPLALTVTVFADPAGVEPIRRGGAKPGDAVFVTGKLGGAWDESGGGAHLTAEPRLLLARQLAEALAADLHSMIDLSDGLARDLLHICEHSCVDAVIETASIPVRDQLPEPRWKRALGDGEDYELCFTVSDSAVARVPKRIGGVPITRIGRTEPLHDVRPCITLHHADGSVEPCPQVGWEHQS